MTNREELMPCKCKSNDIVMERMHTGRWWATCGLCKRFVWTLGILRLRGCRNERGNDIEGVVKAALFL